MTSINIPLETPSLVCALQGKYPNKTHHISSKDLRKDPFDETKTEIVCRACYYFDRSQKKPNVMTFPDISSQVPVLACALQTPWEETHRFPLKKLIKHFLFFLYD